MISMYFLLIVFVISVSSDIVNDQKEFQRQFEGLWSGNNLSLDVFKNEDCKKQMQEYVSGWNLSHPWAFKMFDATSKLAPGILEGNIYELGSFDECLSINELVNENRIQGKYCLSTLIFEISGVFRNAESNTIDIISQIIVDQGIFFVTNKSDTKTDTRTNLRKISLKWSMCIPNRCTADDINSLFNFTNKERLHFKLDEGDCQTLESQTQTRPGDWVVVGLYIFLLCIILLSTAYDVYLDHSGTQENSKPLLQSFSLISNGRSLFRMNKNPDVIHCLNGIRCISMIWIISGHQILSLFRSPIVNTINSLDWLKRLSSQLTIGSTVSVDSFFVMSGCLLMYGFLKAMEKGIPFNIFLYYLHRYIRLTPALAAVLLFTVTLYYQLGSGPFWPKYVKNQETCERYWWSTLLYIQNYVNPTELCLGHTWYLSVEMQLFWISPIILLLIQRFKRYTLHILMILTMISVAFSFAVAWKYSLTITGGSNFFKSYYVATQCRAGSWLVGLMLGFVLHNSKNKKVILNKALATIYWILSITIMIYIVLASYSTQQDGYQYNKVYNVIFIAFNRVVWSICLSWIIFACTHGYGGPVNWFLSLSMFQTFGKLTYCIYLIHFPFINAMGASQKVTQYFNNYNSFFTICGDLVLCTFLGMVLFFIFELPTAKITTILLNGKVKQNPQVNKIKTTNQEVNNETKVDMTENNHNHLKSRL